MQPNAELSGPLERLISVRNFHLVTYGLGDAYCREKFTPIKNRKHMKPEGGLWASPVCSNYGWREWCEAESWGDLKSRFETEFTGRTLVIDSLLDLGGVIWQEDSYGIGYPDYEAMLGMGVDSIFLTEKGQQETRFSHPGLYGYDCECVLVMNPECVRAAIDEARALGAV